MKSSFVKLNHVSTLSGKGHPEIFNILVLLIRVLVGEADNLILLFGMLLPHAPDPFHIPRTAKIGTINGMIPTR